MFGKTPDDSFFEKMDPLVKLWLYESWVTEIQQDLDNHRSLGILIGSFYNPEAARSMLDDNKIEISDSEFDESIRIVEEANKQYEQEEETFPRRRRRRKRIIK